MAASARTETPDEALIAAATRGEAPAFEELLGRHEATVLRVLRLMGVPHQDREDAAQDVFIRVFRHLNGFQRGRPFGAWIYRITLNVAHDYRKDRIRQAASRGPGEPDETADTGGGPEEAVEQRELRRRLLQALDFLSDRERAVFVLRELVGVETREIARSLGITSVTVRRHLGRARHRLQEALSRGSG